MRPDELLERRDLVGRRVVEADDHEVTAVVHRVKPTQSRRGLVAVPGRWVVALQPSLVEIQRALAPEHDGSVALGADDRGDEEADPGMAGEARHEARQRRPIASSVTR